MADVYISCSHVDNHVATHTGATHGWVDVFRDALGARVGEPTIRCDPGSRAFDEVEAELRAAKLFVAIVSPHYLRSAFCSRELAIFSDACERGDGLEVGALWRIFKVVKMPPADGSVPLPHIGSAWYPFYTVLGRQPVELDPRAGDDARAEFALRIEDLASDMRDTLAALAAGTEAAPQDR